MMPLPYRFTKEPMVRRMIQYCAYLYSWTFFVGNKQYEICELYNEELLEQDRGYEGALFNFWRKRGAL